MVNRAVAGISIIVVLALIGYATYLIIENNKEIGKLPSNGEKPPPSSNLERVRFSLKNIPVSCPNGYTNYPVEKSKEYVFKNVNGCIPSVRIPIPTLEYGYYQLLSIAHSTNGTNRIGLSISASIRQDGRKDFLWAGIKGKVLTPVFPLEQPVAVDKPDSPPKEMSFSETSDAYYLGWHTLDGRDYYHKIDKNGTKEDNIIIGHSEFYIYPRDVPSFSVCSSCPVKDTQEGMLSQPNKATLLNYNYKQCVKKASSPAEARLCLNKYTQQLRQLGKSSNLTGMFLPTS